MYVGFVMMALTIPFVYNNCGQAQFGVEATESNAGVVQTNTNLCLSNQVAVGVDVNGNVLCAQKIPHEGQLCPVGETLYDYDGAINTAQCLKNCEFAGNTNNSLCPNGRNLISVGVNNSVICQSHPSHVGLVGSSLSHYLLGFDLDNRPQMEVLVACPGTETELNIECPGNEELIDIIDGANGKEAVCREIVFSPINALCPAGQAYVGVSQNQIICQTIFTGTQNLGTKNCSPGLFLDAVNGELVCKPLPQKNDSHVCPAGSYSVGVVNGLPSCKNLEDSAYRFNGTCAPGQYIIGYAGEQVICEVLPATGNFNEACSNGTYPHAIFNNGLECLQHSYNDQVCAPSSNQLCAVNNGLGSRTCNSNGTAYGACEVSSCFVGYELNSLGLCVSVAVAVPNEPAPTPADTTAPVITINERPAVSTDDNFANITIKAVDEVRVTNLVCRLRSPNGIWTDEEDCKTSEAGTVVSGAESYTALEPGLYIFRAIARDSAGNIAISDYRWTVRLTCEAGEKVSDGRCVPICGSLQNLEGNICVDKYVWVSGNNGDYSYATACSRAGYKALSTRNFNVPHNNSGKDDGQSTVTLVDASIDICRSSEVDRSGALRGVNVHKDNGDYHCYDLIYQNQKTDDDSTDRATHYRCSSERISPATISPGTIPTSITCAPGTFYSSFVGRCISLGITAPVVQPAPSSGGGGSSSSIDGFNTIQLR